MFQFINNLFQNFRNYIRGVSVANLTFVGILAAVLLAYLYKKYMRIPSCPHHPQGPDHNCRTCNMGREYLSGGAIAGIVIGVIVLLIIIVVVVMLVMKKKKPELYAKSFGRVGENFRGSRLGQSDFGQALSKAGQRFETGAYGAASRVQTGVQGLQQRFARPTVVPTMASTMAPTMAPTMTPTTAMPVGTAGVSAIPVAPPLPPVPQVPGMV